MAAARHRPAADYARGMPAFTPSPHSLGVSWVLRQAAVLAVLSVTAVHVAGVACLAVAERRLQRAADSLAAEAALPAASLQSVWSRAERQLEEAGIDSRWALLSVHCIEKPAASSWRPGDEVSFRITAPSRAALPAVLARLAPWLAGEEISAASSVVVP